MNKLESQLISIIETHSWFMKALDTVADLNLPQWCIGAGVIRNIVFDYLDKKASTPIKDVDVAYFDLSNLSEEKEHEYENILKRRVPEIPWEVTNQASVHLWYHKIFGYRVRPVHNIEEAISTWPETCTSIAVTKIDKKNFKIYAPYGLGDLFDMVVRRNPRRCDIRTYNARIKEKQYFNIWKSVKIINENG